MAAEAQDQCGARPEPLAHVGSFNLAPPSRDASSGTMTADHQIATWIGRWFGPMGTGSQRGAVLALASTVFGCGTLAVPWSFAVFGMPLALAVLVGSGLASLLSQRLLANIAFAAGLDSYQSIIQLAFGRKGAVILDCTIFGYIVAVLVAQFIMIGQFGPVLCEALGLTDWLQSSFHITVLLTIFPLTPLCMLRSLAGLTFATVINVGATCMVGIVICCLMPSNLTDLLHLQQPPLEPSWWWKPSPLDWRDIPKAFAICIFGYPCHVNLFAKYREMRSPTPQRVNKVLVRSILVEIAVYGLVGVCGFLAFGPTCEDLVPAVEWPSCTPVNVLASPRFSPGYGTAARIFMILALVVCISLNLVAGRELIESRWFPSAPETAGDGEVLSAPRSSLLWHLTVSILMLYGSAFTAVYYPHIDVILSIAGGGGCTSFMFMFPMAATLVLYFQPKSGQNGESTLLASPSIGDRAPGGTPQIGSWLGVTRSGIFASLLILGPCIILGYFAAGLAVIKILTGSG